MDARVPAWCHRYRTPPLTLQGVADQHLSGGSGLVAAGSACSVVTAIKRHQARDTLIVRLYAEGVWEFEDADRRDGYSVVLFGAKGIQYAHPPAELLAYLRAQQGVTSVQVTFHEDWPPADHSMPPGGFRLALIPGFDFEAARSVRERLALSFWSAQQLLPKRGRNARKTE